MSTRVCQILHNGALAFLVVIARTDEAPENITTSKNRSPSQKTAFSKAISASLYCS
jgi:hypothetical protein